MWEETWSAFIGTGGADASEIFVPRLDLLPQTSGRSSLISNLFEENEHYSIGSWKIWRGQFRDTRPFWDQSACKGGLVLFLPANTNSTFGIKLNGRPLRLQEDEHPKSDSALNPRDICISIEGSRMVATLASLLEEPLDRPIQFTESPGIDSLVCVYLYRFAIFLCDSLHTFDQSESYRAFLLELMNSFTVFILQTFHHNYSSKLSSSGSPAMPRHLKKAINVNRFVEML